MNKYLEKIAEKLQKHQEDALAQLDKEKGVVLQHSTGSGKTKAYLIAIQRAQQRDPKSRALFVAPASLVSNFEKERAKHGISLNMKNIDIRSYEKATREAEELGKNKYSIAVADEAHRLRNQSTQRTKALSEIFSHADTRMLGTATTTYNSLSDASTLINMAANEKLLPENKRDMDEKYTTTTKNKSSLIQRILRVDTGETTRLKNKEELKAILQKWTNHYDVKDDPSNASKFPTKSETTIEVPMSSEQERLYKFMEGKMPMVVRWKIRNNLPLAKQEKASLNSFSSGVRQVGNATRHLDSKGRGDYTPKVLKITESLKKGLKEDPHFRAISYSNFLEAGSSELSKKLTEEGISHSVYTGKLSAKEKDALVKDYNSGVKPVMLISSSGAEGLDLKGTKKVIIMEAHFNKSRQKQVIGRGVRYKSHENLPLAERHVEVENYLSVHKKPLFGKPHTSIDRYLYDNGDDRQKLFDELQDLMK